MQARYLLLTDGPWRDIVVGDGRHGRPSIRHIINACLADHGVRRRTHSDSEDIPRYVRLRQHARQLTTVQPTVQEGLSLPDLTYSNACFAYVQVTHSASLIEVGQMTRVVRSRVPQRLMASRRISPSCRWPWRAGDHRVARSRAGRLCFARMGIEIRPRVICVRAVVICGGSSVYMYTAKRRLE